MFEAAEQARVEAIGALAMKGVAANLAAGLEQRLVQRGLAKARTRDEAPLADVLGLMVREKLTGEKPPASLAAAVDLWRPFIEERAGDDLAKLAGALRDQKAFARLTRTMLNHLALGDADRRRRVGRRGRGRRKPRRPGRRRRGPGRQRQDGESATTESADATARKAKQVESEARPEQSEDLSDATEPEDGAKPQPP